MRVPAPAPRDDWDAPWLFASAERSTPSLGPDERIDLTRRNFHVLLVHYKARLRAYQRWMPPALFGALQTAPNWTAVCRVIESIPMTDPVHALCIAVAAEMTRFDVSSKL